MQQTTTINISMSVILSGRAHKAFSRRPDEVLDELRQSLVGDSETDPDGMITVRNLRIKPQPR